MKRKVFFFSRLHPLSLPWHWYSKIARQRERSSSFSALKCIPVVEMSAQDAGNSVIKNAGRGSWVSGKHFDHGS